MAGKEEHQPARAGPPHRMETGLKNASTSLPFIPKGPLASSGKHSGKWIHRLCVEPEDDAGTCCLGFWVPWILYGKTQYRLQQKSRNKDALDLSEYNACNEPCWCIFMVQYFTHCGWACVMLQHTQIRATYHIDGTCGQDCAQAYFCAICTLIQDEREVRAREQLLIEMNHRGVVNAQPPRGPKMQYLQPICSEGSGSEPPQHRVSLINTMEKLHHATRGPQQENTVMEPPSKEVPRTKRAHYYHGKLEKKPKTILRNGSNDGKPMDNLGAPNVSSDQMSDPKGLAAAKHAMLSTNGPQKPAHAHTRENRLCTVSSENSLASTFGRARHSDIKGQADPSHTVPERSEGESADQLNKSPGSNYTMRPHTVAEMEESVLVYYSDGDHPQRHRLTDCAKDRASTPGQPDSGRYEHELSDSPSNDVTSSIEPSESVGQHHLAECAEIESTSSITNVSPQHVLDDCISGTINDTGAVVQGPEEDRYQSGHAETEPIVEPTESVVPDEHTIGDCAVDEVQSDVVTDTEPHAAFHDITISELDHQDSSTGSYTETVTMTAKVNQPPLIIVTTTEGDNGNSTSKDILPKSKNNEGVIRTDAESLQEHEIAECGTVDGNVDLSASERENNHGVVDAKDESKTSQATAALRKVLAGSGMKENVTSDMEQESVSDDWTDGSADVPDPKAKNKDRNRAGRARGNTIKANSSAPRGRM